MFSEYLPQPTVGPSYLAHSRFYNEVLNILCSLLNNILKVKNRVVVSVLVVSPRDRGADWEPQLTAAAHHHKKSLLVRIASLGKVQFLLSVYPFRTFIKSKNHNGTILSWGLSYFMIYIILAAAAYIYNRVVVYMILFYFCASCVYLRAC